MKKAIVLALGAACATSAFAQSFAVATFSDPAAGSGTPIFTFDTTANTLQGSWTGLGLTLTHPGFTSGGSTSNVTFQTSVINLTPIAGQVYSMGAGTVDFFDSSSNLIFSISFSGGLFVNPFSASSAEIAGDSVSFSGPNVPSGLTNESFSFSLANAVRTANGWQYTSAFTSSAVPEPGSMLVLGAGIAALAARRRRK
jgi:hypothetical protein